MANTVSLNINQRSKLGVWRNEFSLYWGIGKAKAVIAQKASLGPAAVLVKVDGLYLEGEGKIIASQRAALKLARAGIAELSFDQGQSAWEIGRHIKSVGTASLHSLRKYSLQMRDADGESYGIPISWQDIKEDIPRVQGNRKTNEKFRFGWGFYFGGTFVGGWVGLSLLNHFNPPKKYSFESEVSLLQVLGVFGVAFAFVFLLDVSLFCIPVISKAVKDKIRYFYYLSRFSDDYKEIYNLYALKREIDFNRLNHILPRMKKTRHQLIQTLPYENIQLLRQNQILIEDIDVIKNSDTPREILLGFLYKDYVETDCWNTAYERLFQSLTEVELVTILSYLLNAFSLFLPYLDKKLRMMKLIEHPNFPCELVIDIKEQNKVGLFKKLLQYSKLSSQSLAQIILCETFFPKTVKIIDQSEYTYYETEEREIWDSSDGSHVDIYRGKESYQVERISPEQSHYDYRPEAIAKMKTLLANRDKDFVKATIAEIRKTNPDLADKLQEN